MGDQVILNGSLKSYCYFAVAITLMESSMQYYRWVLRIVSIVICFTPLVCDAYLYIPTAVHVQHYEPSSFLLVRPIIVLQSCSKSNIRLISYFAIGDQFRSWRCP